MDSDIEALLGPEPIKVYETAPKEMASLGGAYEGASRLSRELSLWNPPIYSADRDILPEKVISDSRVRDTLRNDAYVRAGASLHRNSIVGSLFLLNAKPELRVLGLDETWATEFQEEIESKFMLGAESPNNWFDAQRVNTFTSLIRLMVGIYVSAGEVLASVEWLRDGLRPFNTAIQLIDLDRLSNPWGQMDSPILRGGVARNKYGAPTGFHIRQGHPSDPSNPAAHTWKFVPIRKPWGRLQVMHVFDQARPDQTRGIAEMVAALKEVRLLRTHRDIRIQNAIVNATYAAAIESELPHDVVAQTMGAKLDPDATSEAITSYAESYLSAVAEYVGSSKNIMLGGVKVPHLFPGTKLHMHPAGKGGEHEDVEPSLLRYLAANLDVSYEELSRDLNRTNYSSFQAARNQTWKAMVAKKRKIADHGASTIYRLWFEEGYNKKSFETLKFSKAPDYYEGLNADAYTACEWIGASRGQIDELKETQAAVLRIKYRLSTYEEELARLGKDWRKSFKQVKRELDLMIADGIEPDSGSDNMMNAASGEPRRKEGRRAAEDDD